MKNEYPSTGSRNIQKDIWNNFVIENNVLFLQSWEWGEFQESLGRKIWRIGDCGNWAALVIKYDLPLGKNYLYCPAGPVLSIKYDVISIMPIFLEEAKKIAQKEKSIFLRIEPFWKKDTNRGLLPERIRQLAEKSKADKNETLRQAQGINLKDLNFKKSDGGQRILKTLVLDLHKSEEELLAEMKQKTRYNIRLAEKHGVKIRISDDMKNDFESFWKLTQETIERDKFSAHSKEHYEKLLLLCYSHESGNPESFQAKLFLAEYQNKIIAANIVVFFGNRAIYLHGASSNEHRNLMAPYLLQWEQIREAKKRGCELYDFWGIDEKKWQGVTRFKNGFSGKEIDYVGTYDYVFDRMWYWIYRVGKLLSQMPKFKT